MQQSISETAKQIRRKYPRSLYFTSSYQSRNNSPKATVVMSDKMIYVCDDILTIYEESNRRVNSGNVLYRQIRNLCLSIRYLITQTLRHR